MNRGERTELKSIVRGQFKVLRHEVEQRQAELNVEASERVAEHFSESDRKWENTLDLVREAMREANRRVNDILYEQGYQTKGRTERIWVRDLPDEIAVSQKPTDGQAREMRSRADQQIGAQVKAAKLRLDRDEADLLRTLAIGALESEDAQQFLANIPTVGELVSSARLAELEAAAGDAP
ncbi:MAG: hypothetical protein M3Y91_06755 [Actinomycetota bacterium]|nr:hypothetical protein [Actinomycetota bacterium]